MKYYIALSLLLLSASNAKAFPAPLNSTESPPTKKSCMTCEITCENSRDRSFYISVYQESGCPTPGEHYSFLTGSSTLVQCEPVSSSAEYDEGACVCSFTPCEVRVKAVGP